MNLFSFKKLAIASSVFLASLIVMTEDAEAQHYGRYGGRSGFSISIGTGGFGPGFGSFGSFGPRYGYGGGYGYGVPHRSVYARPVYVAPVPVYRGGFYGGGFYGGGGYGRGYGGGYGRSCGGW